MYKIRIIGDIIMGISIIHLTDIHLRNKNNSIESKIDALKKACCSPIISRTPVFIVVSGDIAFSGKEDEYIVAYNLFKEISDYINSQKNTEVKFIMVPGNHDCDFDLSNTAREDLQSRINNKTKIDESYTNLLTEVQRNYKGFCEEIGCPLEKDIITPKEMVIGDGKILFLLVNTAWMSKLKEEPGKIIIPKNLLSDVDIQSYKIVVTVMHHPLNWLDPENAVVFKEYLRRTTDLLLVGHEHRIDEYITEGKNWLINEKYGKELQDSNSSDSAFVIYNFDNSFSNLNKIEFKWNDKTLTYERESDGTDYFRRNSIVSDLVIYPNEDTIEQMNDVGIVVSHFSAEDIILPEIYSWPELELLDFKPNSLANKRISDNIFNTLTSKKISLILGDSLTGKTSLAKMMFLEFVKQAKCCILLKGEDIYSCLETNLNRIIENIFCNQYSDSKLENFRQLPKEKKAIIIDDFDDLKFYDDKRTQIIRFLSDTFDNIILLFNTEMNVPMLFSALESDNNESIQAYKILYMGNIKRKEFIRNWYYLRDTDACDPEKESKIDNGVELVNRFLGNGKRFIPAIPIFIINALQNSDAFSSTTFNGSQYGFLYESLINKSLSTISSQYKGAGAMNIDINILSNLAFEMLDNSRTYFSKDDLYNIVDQFKEQKKLNLSAESILDKMIKAKIIYEEMINCYKYRYPYIFYYFSGRYIAYNMKEQKVKDKVEYMSSRLYNEQYGNIMIFVCHFANSLEIIETILLNAYVSLDTYEIFDFNKNKDLFTNAQSLIDKILIPECVGDNDDIESHKEKALSNMDDAGIQDGSVSEIDDTICDEINDKERDLASIAASIKTMDVLGQILQNYPGDIDGNVKMDIIDEVYNLGMRVINALISTIGLVEEDLIIFLIDKAKKDKKSYTHDQIATATKSFLSVLLAGMVRGMINKVASSMSGEYLLPALTESFQKDNSISKNLILQEIKFNCLRSPDINESLKLFDEIEVMNIPFALSILQSIVGHYLKYNRCDYKTRAKLCEKYGFKNNRLFVEGVKNVIQQ